MKGYILQTDAGLRVQIVGVDTQVPTMQGERRYRNLDNAATTPPFEAVLHAIDEYMPWYASVHRGSGFKSRLSTAVYEAARQTVLRFVGAHPDEFVAIFGKNTTEAINKLSYRLRLRKKDIVLISHLEHHSNDLPWRAQAIVKRIGMTPDGGIDTHDFERLLRTYAGRVRLVAITGASNVTGYMPDIYWFARRTHEAGAEIFVDCAQLVAHRPVRMGRLHDPEHLDFIAFSGHKMYAPFGCGVLVGRRDAFTRTGPEYSGGGTIQVVTPNTIDWALPPDSDEAGSPNVAGAMALARAMETLETIGFDRIRAHEAKLTAYALKRLKEVPGTTLYGDIDPGHAPHHGAVIPFTMKDLPSQLVAAVLGFEWGVGVRAGCFCAQPYVMSLLGVSRPDRQRIRHHILHRRRDLAPGMVRVSFGLYNTTADVDVLIEALQAIATGRYGPYVTNGVTGMYTPVDLHEDFRPYFVT